jgi:excisionase family DNA binding protein
VNSTFHVLTESSVDHRTRRLLTVNETAAYLSVSRQQVYALLERGDLSAVRVGTRLRFFPEELRTYLEQHREGKSPP